MSKSVRGCSPDIENLLRAYNLLVATRDDQRALIGVVSRQWLKSESEQYINIADLPDGVLRTVRGRQIVCDTLTPDFDANAEQLPFDSQLHQLKATGKAISSNCLAKLEPSIAADVLLGAMLMGVQKYGNRRRGSSTIDNNLIIAAMIRDTLGCTDRYSAVLPGNRTTVNLSVINALFGREICKHLVAIKKSYEQFLGAYLAGQCHKLKLSRAHANVIAAIEASQLRLVARAAGDEVLGNLDLAKQQELATYGIDCSGDFPERPYLSVYYHRTKAALGIHGVDYGALAEPLEHTLMMSVSDVLEDSRKKRRLVGRRGKAVQDVHNNLPLVELFNAADNYNSLGTIHLAALEMMQYLEKGRRKSAGTMIGHSLRIAAVAEQIFGPTLEPSVATVAILHDVVEDGSRPVAGYDQSLNKIKNRFGGPLAAMVSELTDAESSVAAAEKARATLECDGLILPQQQYNFDRFTEMTLQATATYEPYTLCGIVTKLIDTAISEEEGIRDPDVMNGWWKHSGVRIYWSCRLRGRVVRPLLVKLVREIEKHQNTCEVAGESVHAEAILPTDLPTDLIESLRRLVAYSIQSSDRYAVQNLAILADEYGLSCSGRSQLIAEFFDPGIDQSSFLDKSVSGLLEEANLQQRIDAGHVPSRCYVTLYSKDSDNNPEFDPSAFLEYRAAALQRQQLSRRLGLAEVSLTGVSYPVDEIISLYDLRKAA